MAAGLGFKTFTTGEVLTAADTNGYLMQGINVFASSAARAAAITSPQEGQYSYLKDTNALEYYDGAAWVGAPVGDITAVTAGTGISGGGASGAVTITNSMATEIAAKGDLIAGTGAATFDNLTVGANNTMLVADSTTATGLAYKSAATLYPWTTYSPTTSGFTKGNGTEVARYQQIGKTVFIDYAFTFGSTSAMTGLVRIGMPVSPAGATAFNACGNVLFEDKDTAFYLGSCVVQAFDWINVYIDKADGTYTREGYTSSTVPFTWGNTDRFFLSVSYEAA